MNTPIEDFEHYIAMLMKNEDAKVPQYVMIAYFRHIAKTRVENMKMFDGVMLTADIDQGRVDADMMADMDDEVPGVRLTHDID